MEQPTKPDALLRESEYRYDRMSAEIDALHKRVKEIHAEYEERARRASVAELLLSLLMLAIGFLVGMTSVS